MTLPQFPSLPLGTWQATRDTIRSYAHIIGTVRRVLTPAQKHYWHLSLKTNATGFTTTPILVNGASVELQIDFVNHMLHIQTSRGEKWSQRLTGQSPAQFCAEVLGVLGNLGIDANEVRSEFPDNAPGAYDSEAVARYWQALAQIDGLLNQFKGKQRRETSPVQLWPHHFDMSLVWFSGRLVPETDPTDADYSDEQMAFGFSTGDEGIPEPYFYITAYPLPEGLAETDLPDDAVWHTEGFTGAAMMYTALVDADNPTEKLLNFWRTLQAAGEALMQ